MTTYVLGAGASFHGGYPLCSELWPKMIAWVIETLPVDAEYRQAIDLVIALNGPASDVESLFTDLDMGRGAFRALAEVQRGRVNGRIRRCIAAYFGSIRKQDLRCDLYEAFAAQIDQGDVVVTFNYDVALENELIRAGKFRVRNGYGTAFTADWDEAGSDVTVLKPHGSVNWIAALFGGMTAKSASVSNSLGQRPFVDNTDLSFDEYPNRVLDKSFTGGGVAQSTTLILPTYEKDFSVRTSLGVEWVDFYESLWLQAVEALERSDRIVVVGYSMPEADHRARALLLWNANKRAEILICCSSSNANIKKRFNQHGFIRVREVGSFTDLITNGMR